MFSSDKEIRNRLSKKKLQNYKMSDAKFDAAFAKGDKDGSGGIGKHIKRVKLC